jgi:hypothetical protein
VQSNTTTASQHGKHDDIEKSFPKDSLNELFSKYFCGEDSCPNKTYYCVTIQGQHYPLSDNQPSVLEPSYSSWRGYSGFPSKHDTAATCQTPQKAKPPHHSSSECHRCPQVNVHIYNKDSGDVTVVQSVSFHSPSPAERAEAVPVAPSGPPRPDEPDDWEQQTELLTRYVRWHIRRTTGLAGHYTSALDILITQRCSVGRDLMKLRA